MQMMSESVALLDGSSRHRGPRRGHRLIAGAPDVVKLFEPATFRGVELRNRIVVSPMGMYSAENGYVTPFHLVHYGQFAMGGAGLVYVEQTSVSRPGRITNGDPGLWEDGQIEGMAAIARGIKAHGAKAAIQINHGGRKSGQQPCGASARLPLRLLLQRDLHPPAVGGPRGCHCGGGTPLRRPGPCLRAADGPCWVARGPGSRA